MLMVVVRRDNEDRRERRRSCLMIIRVFEIILKSKRAASGRKPQVQLQEKRGSYEPESIQRHKLALPLRTRKHAQLRWNRTVSVYYS